MAQLWFVGQQIGELNFTACKFVPCGIIAHTSYKSEMCTITIISRLLFHSGTGIQKKYNKIAHIFGICYIEGKKKYKKIQSLAQNKC